jgi:hypothetical protein
MTPEKFFDYLEGKLPPPEREALEHALIRDPELQKQFVAARQVHRSLGRSPEETLKVARAGARGRQVAAAFAVLVLLNVSIGLYFVSRSAKPSPEIQKAQMEAIRRQVENSAEKAAAASFSPPTIAPEPIRLTVPAEKQEQTVRSIIAAAEKAGGSGAKGLPNEQRTSVFVVIPASAEIEFRKILSTMGGQPAPSPTASPVSPNEPVHLEIVLAPAAAPR